MKTPLIASFSGKLINPLDLKVEDIKTADIFHGLNNESRFSGQTGYKVSVLAHSYVVADLLPHALKIEGILHDASEAYMKDIPTPIKILPQMEFYRVAEKKAQDAIRSYYGLGLLSDTDKKLIKEADDTALIIEKLLFSNYHKNYTKVDFLTEEYARYHPVLQTAFSKYKNYQRFYETAYSLEHFSGTIERYLVLANRHPLTKESE